jgi:hypothetical protein
MNEQGKLVVSCFAIQSVAAACCDSVSRQNRWCSGATARRRPFSPEAAETTAGSQSRATPAR